MPLPDPNPPRNVLEEFDHNSPEYFERRFMWFDRARERGPVFYTPHNGGHWVVAGLRELIAAARNWESFSSEHRPAPVDGVRYDGSFIPPKNRAALLNDDPPIWNALRLALAPRFRAPAIEVMRPLVQHFVDQRIDAHSERGRIDLVEDLCNPVPTMTIMELAGLPLDDWIQWSSLLHLYAHLTPSDEGYGAMQAELSAQQQLLVRRVAEQRRRPVPGSVISHLLGAEVLGRHLSDEQIAGVVRLIIGGGVDTTASTLATALLALTGRPDLRQRLLGDPDAPPTAVEELLRWGTPTQGLCRTVTRDIELGGQLLRRGERVMLCFAGANRDPSAFPDPDEIALDRHPNQHVAFGAGLHKCIGAPLARLEMEVVLTTAFRRMPDLAVEEDDAPPYPNCGVVAGFIRMPATFTPSPRLGAAEHVG